MKASELGQILRRIAMRRVEDPDLSVAPAGVRYVERATTRRAGTQRKEQWKRRAKKRPHKAAALAGRERKP